MPKEHPRYKEITDLIAGGNLAPQDFIAELLRDRVSKPDCASGFIFDGWGRKKIDLEYFDPGFDKVIFLKISPETAIARLSGRRTCRKCGKIYNVVTAPPRVADVCDVCGGELYQREDDTEEGIRKRLAVFYSDTQEVLEGFRAKGILIEIDAEPSPDSVFESVLKALEV